MPVETPENRVIQSESELHVGLPVPRHAAKQIHNWVLKQAWPEGVQLEHAKDYHITLLYSSEGHDEHKDAWWIEHLEHARVSIKGFKTFPAQQNGYAYVLIIDSPDVQVKAEEMQGRAEWAGLPITQFEGGYQPHITIGYGPTSRVSVRNVPEFQFDVGPSEISSPRPPEKTSSKPPRPPNYRPQDKASEHCGNCKMHWQGKCWGFANVEISDDYVCNDWYPEHKRSAYDPNAVEILDKLSLTNVAANLHYKFEEGGLDAAGATDYTKRLLKLIGYPQDDITVQAAIQAWQQMYPDDKLVDMQAQSDALQASPTVPAKSWGYGTTSHLGAITNWNEVDPTPGPDVGIRSDHNPPGTPFQPSETLRHHIYGRDTGHFGTGLYFVSTPEAAGALRDRQGLRGIDLSGANLYRPRTNKEAYALHDDLKTLNTLGNSGKYAYEGKGWRYPSSVEHLIRLPRGILPATQQKMRDAIDGHYADIQAGNLDSDTASTRFMRSMGYDGIDTRHLNHDADSLSGLDNTMYGSVLYRPVQQHSAKLAELGEGTKPLYHWVDASEIHDWMDPAHTGPGQTYLTETGDDPSLNWNPDVPTMHNPVRLTIDPSYLDSNMFDPQYEGWHGNHLYHGPVPPESVVDIKPFKAPDEWSDWESTVPSQVNNPEDHWPDFGERPADQKRDIQFSNDWGIRATNVKRTRWRGFTELDNEPSRVVRYAESGDIEAAPGLKPSDPAIRRHTKVTAAATNDPTNDPADDAAHGEITYRPAEVGERFNAVGPRGGLQRSQRSEDEHVINAYLGNQLIGSGFGYGPFPHHGGSMHLAGVWVHPSFRQQGIGKRLINEFVRYTGYPAYARPVSPEGAALWNSGSTPLPPITGDPDWVPRQRLWYPGPKTSQPQEPTALPEGSQVTGRAEQSAFMNI